MQLLDVSDFFLHCNEGKYRRLLADENKIAGNTDKKINKDVKI